MGDLARTADKVWTAEEFLRTDQREFGDAWRYELVDGRSVSHAAATPAHAKIVVAFGGALTARMTGKDGCFPESGSGRGTGESATGECSHSRRDDPMRRPAARAVRGFVAIGTQAVA